MLELLSAELKTILIATLPIIELRGAIPVGLSLGLAPLQAFLAAFLGSMLPVPILLLWIKPMLRWMEDIRIFKRFVDRLRLRGIRKSTYIRRYGWLGLVLFVSIPLPGTGVWSGTLAAALLDIRFKIAFPAILCGNLIAGALVLALSHGLMQGIFG